MEVARPKMEGAKPKSFHLVEKDTFCFSNLLGEGICLIESSLFLYFTFMCHFLLVLNSLRLSLFSAQSESAAIVNLVSLFLDFRFLIMLELFARVSLFGFCASHRCCVGILWVRKSNERHTNWPEVGSFFWHKSVHQILLHHMLVKCILMYTESKLDMKTWPRLFKLQRSGMKFFCSCKNAHNLKTQSTSIPMNKAFSKFHNPFWWFMSNQTTLYPTFNFWIFGCIAMNQILVMLIGAHFK